MRIRGRTFAAVHDPSVATGSRAWGFRRNRRRARNLGTFGIHHTGWRGPALIQTARARAGLGGAVIVPTGATLQDAAMPVIVTRPRVHATTMTASWNVCT